MSADKTAPAPEPKKPAPATPIDQAEHGRVRKPHGGAAPQS